MSSTKFRNEITIRGGPETPQEEEKPWKEKISKNELRAKRPYDLFPNGENGQEGGRERAITRCLEDALKTRNGKRQKKKKKDD